MSRLRRKDPNRKRKPKQPELSFRKICEDQLQIARNKIKEEDDDKVEELIDSKVLKKDGSYKHVANVARDLEWSTSRVFRSLERLDRYAKIQERIKKQIEAEMKKAEAKEKENESGQDNKETQD